MTWRDFVFPTSSRLSHRNFFQNDIAVDELFEFVGNAEEALLYASLFNPLTIVIDGLVFLKNQINLNNLNERVSHCRSSGWSEDEIERSFNFVEVGYMFNDRETDEAIDGILADCLRDTWELVLNARYPERRFDVTVIGEEDSGSITSLTFCQQRAK